MKFAISRDHLAKALSAVARIVPRRTTIPILSNVLIRAEGGALTIAATDLDIEARVTIAARVESDGVATAPGAMLHDIVGKLPASAEITIEYAASSSSEVRGDAAKKNNARLALRAGRSRFMLPVLPAADFPDIAAGDLPHRFTLPAAALSDLIARTRFAISTDETRYYLNGLYLHVARRSASDQQVLRGVATDGHRLAMADLDLPDGADGLPGVIVPAAVIAEWERIARAGGEFAIELSAGKIRLTQTRDADKPEALTLVLTSKLVDGTYPDYQRVVPVGNDKEAVTDREAFAAAVGRVAAVSGERGRAVKLSFAGDGLALSVCNPDAGDASDEIDIDYAAAPIEIGFNASYLEDILAVLGGDRVRVKLADPASPTLFSPCADDRHLVVLMPMRV